MQTPMYLFGIFTSLIRLARRNQQKDQYQYVEHEQGEIEGDDKVHLVLKQTGSGHDVMDIEDRQHHRGQCFSGNAEREQRNHGGGRDCIIRYFRRDQPF